MTTLQLDVSLDRGKASMSVAADLHWQGILGLVGASGAGKTTLLRVLAGLEPTARGRIVLDDGVLLDAARRIALPAHRRRVGMIFQDARLFTHLSVDGNLRYARKRATPGDGPQWDDVVPALQLGPLLSRRVDTLSGGEAQRVAIGRALLGAPRLLLLDEPVSALDAAMRGEVLSAIETVRDRFALPMIYVTHAHEELRRLAPTQVRIDAGRLLDTIAVPSEPALST